jgi:peptidoglycan/xylan/chitin deacetylase (PgdA/CDA1 family)
MNRKIFSLAMAVIMLAGLGLMIIPAQANTPNYGDVDGNGIINSADVTLLRRRVSQGNENNLPNYNRANADVNGDGVIDANDVTLLRRHVAATDPSTVILGPARRTFTRANFPPGARFLSLTYDDGPNRSVNEGTIGVLNNLRDIGAYATFYVQGQKVAGHVDILQRMVREGHDVDNHSWNHPDFRQVSQTEGRRQIINTSNAIYNAIGIWPWSFRAPYLEWGGSTITGLDVTLNMPFMGRNVETNDYTSPPVSTLLAHVNNANDGDIILFHDDGGPRPNTVAVIPQFTGKQAQGFHFVTVRQLYEINNVSPILYAGQQWPCANTHISGGVATGGWLANRQPLYPNWPQGPGRPATVPAVTPY